jgi:hypothetical protein
MNLSITFSPTPPSSPQPLKRKIGGERVVNQAQEIFKSSKPVDDVRPLKKQKITETNSLVTKKFNFIYDQFTESRGEPKMLEISCKKCHTWIMDYQKDGPGNLLRCYVDRIYHPSALRERTFTNQTIKTVSDLKCSKCHTCLAKPIIYTRIHPKKEIRAAYKVCNYGYRNSVVEFKERIK